MLASSIVVIALQLVAPPLTRRTVLVAAGACTLATPVTATAAGDERDRLRRGLVELDNLLLQWTDLTVDCRYGEIRRELLGADSKEQLLKEASSMSKSSTMETLCKTNPQIVRAALGTSRDGPLSKPGALLQKPALIDALDDVAFDEYQAVSEQLQTAISAADAAAFAAGNDYSAQTTFKRGATPSSPNLNTARDFVVEARDSLVTVCKLVGVL
mgnify:CR=1 FL=1